MYEPRTYRQQVKSDDLLKFEIIQDETDLMISAESDLSKEANAIVKKIRAELAGYIIDHPEFETSFIPVPVEKSAPFIVKEMASQAEKVNVGPFAGVAGAVAEFVGKELLKYSRQIIVENGGDVFIASSKTRIVGIYAGNSPLTGKIAIEIDPSDTPLGICTSSGTVGPSFSFGTADAVVVISKSATLADAAATAIGNLVLKQKDIDIALDYAKNIKDIDGVLIIKDDKMGIYGKIKIVKI